jgi:uncharacterized protein (TIGR00369 family)
MSGAGAAIVRSHLERERNTLPPSRVAALSVLADRVRELTEAVVHTAVDDGELAALSAEVAALTERLSAARHPHPPFGDATHGIERQLGNPVSGRLNPLAPPIDVEVLPDGTARAVFTLSAVYEGPPTFVHGGVSALILDQLLGVAASASGTPGMTATLELRYRRPTPLGVPLTAEAKSTGAEGRKSWADGRILDPDGRTTVEATAMFVTPRF